MSWGYVAIAAASAYSAYTSGQAADAQEDAANRSIEEKRRNYALIRADTRMSRMSGEQAQIALNDMMGIETENPFDKEVAELEAEYKEAADAPLSTRGGRRGFGITSAKVSLGFGGGSSGERRMKSRQLARDAYLADIKEKLDPLKEKQEAFSARGKYDFRGSPGYQFRLAEGQKGLERTQAGRRLGGRAAKEAIRYGQGFATREYEAQFSRLSSIANRGQGAVAIGAGAQPDTSGEFARIGAAGALEQAGRSEAAQTGLGEAAAWYEYNNPSTSTSQNTSGSLY